MGLLSEVSSGHYEYESDLTIYVDFEDFTYPNQKSGHGRDIKFFLSGTTYVAAGHHADLPAGGRYSMPLEAVSVYAGSKSLYQWVADLSGGGEDKYVANPWTIQVNVGDGLPDLSNNGRNCSPGGAFDNFVDPVHPVVVVDSANWFDIVGVFDESVLTNSFAANNGFQVLGKVVLWQGM